MRIRQIIVAAMALLMVTGFGCVARTNTNQLQPDHGPSMSSSASRTPFGDPKYQELVDQIRQKNGDLNAVTEHKSVTASVTDTLKKASTAVGDALTIKPRVIPADDPVSLSSKPKSINVDVYYQAGRLAESKGNQSEAMKQYTRALEKQADHVPTIISLARLHDRQGKFGEAVELYRRAIQVAPDNAMAHNDLGLCLARQDRHPEAAGELQQAIQLEPTRKLYHNNLATVLVSMGRVDDAWSELNSVHPPAVAHYNLGFLLNRAGQKHEAFRQFELACQADASLGVARAMRDQLAVELGATPGQTASVRYRVDDALAHAAAPRPPVPHIPASAGQARAAAQTPTMRVQATPASTVLSPVELRRIPATGRAATNGVVTPQQPPPAIRLSPPVSQHPGLDAYAPASVDQPPHSANLQFPIRRMSGSVPVSPDERDLDLPTPRQLKPVVGEPALWPTPQQ